MRYHFHLQQTSLFIANDFNTFFLHKIIISIYTSKNSNNFVVKKQHNIEYKNIKKTDVQIYLGKKTEMCICVFVCGRPSLYKLCIPMTGDIK